MDHEQEARPRLDARQFCAKTQALVHPTAWTARVRVVATAHDVARRRRSRASVTATAKNKSGTESTDRWPELLIAQPRPATTGALLLGESTAISRVSRSSS